MGQECVKGDRSISALWSENHLSRGSGVRTEPTQGCEKDPQRRWGWNGQGGARKQGRSLKGTEAKGELRAAPRNPLTWTQ